MDLSPENLKKHLLTLNAKAEKIEAKLQPLRDELDGLVAGDGDLTVKEARKREEKIRPQIKALQAELAPIENERGVVTRALGGKSLTVEQ